MMLIVNGVSCSPYPDKLVFCVVVICCDGTTNFRGLSGHIPIVVVLVGEVGVFQELIRLIKRRCAVLVRVGSIADSIVGVVFRRIPRQWINRLNQTIQSIVSVICGAVVVSLRLPIPHVVVAIAKGVDGCGA